MLHPRLCVLASLPLLSAATTAQDQEPFPRPLPGATVPQATQPQPGPRAQDPVPTAVGSLQDPTRPDAELLRRLGATPGERVPTAPATPTLPRVQLRAVLAGSPDRVVTMLDVDDVAVRAEVGGSFASNGRVVRVEKLVDGDLVLRTEGLDTALVVPLGIRGATSNPGRIARIDLRGVHLEQAARLLSDLSGLNIAVSSQAASLPVSTYLADVEPLVAVRVICESHQLWWRREPETGVVRISTASEYQRDLVELQEDRTETFTLHYPNVFDVGRALRELYGDRVIVRQQSLQDESLIDLSNRLSRFDLLDGRQQGFGQTVNGNGLGNGAFGAQSRFGSGFGGGFGAGFGGAGIGGNFGNVDGGVGAFGPQPFGGIDQFVQPQRQEWTADQIQRLERALERLEQGSDSDARRDVEREVTSRMRSPIFVTIAPRQNKVVVRTRDAATLEQIRLLVASLDVPTALVLLEVRVLSIDDLDGFESFFEYQGARGSIAGQMTTGNIAAPTPPSLAPGGTGIRSGDLLFQYVDSRFAARMQLLERDNRVRSLATPILLTANNEVSRLFVGKEVPINRSFVGGQVNQNQNTTTTTAGTTGIEFRPVGTTLLMTPSINSDRTVTLKIVQEQSNADSTASVLVPSETGFVAQTVNVVSSQTVSGTIVAKSDLAVAFGGLVETSSSDSTEKVPLLGDIPLLGMLFRRDIERKTRREIVIVVKPYVIGTPAEQVGRSRDVLRDLGIDENRLEPKRANGEAPPEDQKLFRGPGRPGFRVQGVDDGTGRKGDEK